MKKNECENPKCPCKGGYWLDNLLVCQLHHINGDNTDNRLDNLQILCPNCHSQTDNYCGSANTPQKYYCELCGVEKKTKESKYCPTCASKIKRKVERPDKEEILNKIKELNSIVKVGKYFNVSDNCIRKWLKIYDLPTKSKELKEFISKI